MLFVRSFCWCSYILLLSFSCFSFFFIFFFLDENVREKKGKKQPKLEEWWKRKEDGSLETKKKKSTNRKEKAWEKRKEKRNKVGWIDSRAREIYMALGWDGYFKSLGSFAPLCQTCIPGGRLCWNLLFSFEYTCQHYDTSIKFLS